MYVTSVPIYRYVFYFLGGITMEYNYDVIVVGAGPTGIFTCYELKEKNPKLKILLVDKGLDIYSRKCPILDKKINKCPVNREGVSGCYPACSITNGFGGAGAYSDGKFNITSEFGGWMTEYMERNQVEELIKYVDSINLKHGATRKITDPTTKEVKDIETIVMINMSLTWVSHPSKPRRLCTK